MEREARPAIEISASLYRLLEQRADEINATPGQVAETILRVHLVNTVHIEQRPSPFGPQAYLRGTRVAVRHVAAFLQAGFTVDEIIEEGLPHVFPAAIYEAIAYYYDHRDEIDAELNAESAEAAHAVLREQLTPEQFYRLTHQTAE